MAGTFPGFYPDAAAYPGEFGGSSAGTTISVTPEPDATPPRNRLDIVSDQTSLIIYRVLQDGSRTPVRTYDGGPLLILGGTTFLYDPEIPQGQPVTYAVDGVDYAATGPVVVDSGVVWLVDPLIPSRSMPVRVAGISDRMAAAGNQSVRYPLGAEFPIVANDGQRKADTYTLTLRTKGQAEIDALRALLSGLSTLLLNVPTSKRWVDLQTEYIAIGDVPRGNPTNWGKFQHRNWSLPCTVTTSPAAGSQAFITYDYLYALYPTYNDWAATGKTYNQLFDPE